MRLVGLLIALIVSGPALANPNCFSVSGNDRYLCLATTRNNAAYCTSIQERDVRIYCNVQVTGRREQCGSMSSSYNRRLCRLGLPPRY